MPDPSPNDEKKKQPAATPAPEPEAAKDASAKSRPIRRLQIGTNVVLQIIITLIIVLMLNYLGFRHFKRWDFSRNQSYTLSDKTLKLLDGLENDVQFYISFDEADPIYTDLDALLKEYQIRSGGRVRIEYVNRLRDPGRWEELYKKFKVRERENVVIIDSGENFKFVYGSDMVQYAPVDPLLAQVQKKPDILAFLGEQKLTSALQQVIMPERPKVYFVQGHREPAFMGTEENPSPLSTFQNYLSKENVDMEPLFLIGQQEVPEEADALIFIGPQIDLGEREVEMLDAYWDRGGRIIFFLDPAYNLPNVVEFCAERGIIPRRDRVITTMPIRGMDGKIGIVTIVPAGFTDRSPITQNLVRAGIELHGAGSLELSEVTARTQELDLAPLMVAQEGFWGETEYVPDSPVLFEPEVDAAAPLILAASAEKAGKEGARRLIVVGNSSMAQDEFMRQIVNVDFFLGSMNWLLDRQELIGIAPKARNDFRISLNSRQKGQLFALCVIGVPCAAAVLGILVWLRRRR